MRSNAVHLALLDLACTHKSYGYRSNKQNGTYEQSWVQKISSAFLKIFTRFTEAWVKHSSSFVYSKLNISTVRFTDTEKNNEQLEFLGDAVLNTVITEYLLWRFPHKLEGFLSRIKSYVVSRNALYYVASRLQLHQILKCDASVMLTLPHDIMQVPLAFSEFKKIATSYVHAPLANVVEALIGALYISRGMRITRSFIVDSFSPIVNAVIEGTHNKDYKSMLQHYTQSIYHIKPTYTIVNIAGTEHEKKYTATVQIKDVEKTITHTFRSIEAFSKKQAEQESAKSACKALNVQENDVLF